MTPTPEEPPIIIAGAGPVGLLLTIQLSRLGIPCLLAERNTHTTRWPKMDLTNCRSMEIFRVLGLAAEYRALEGGVPDTARFDSIFVSGLPEGGRVLGCWRLPPVKEQTEYIKRTNDGSQPAEAPHRCSQIILEPWLKGLVVDGGRCPGVTSRFGWSYTGHREDVDGVTVSFLDLDGQTHEVRGRYLVGCDGGSSTVRRNAGIRMLGGRIPIRFYLVHFRSAQLAEEITPRFGRFWHAFFPRTGFIIDQDEKDTFTAHYPLPLPVPPTQDTDTDPTTTASKPPDPEEIIHKVLGGYTGPWRIKIDSILAHSEWQPSFSIASHYSTPTNRVLLAGDAAHRNPPHGGYGMNSGVVDAVDLAWRLAAIVKGYGGGLLLDAYSAERRPMQIRALRRSLRHLMEHVRLGEMYERDWDFLLDDDDEEEGEGKGKGKAVREAIEKFITLSGPDTLDHGIELDLRYDDSPSVYPDETAEDVPWEVGKYKPSTKPGHRAPHVFLKDGATSTYDLFGREWTLIQFWNEEAEDGDADADSVQTKKSTLLSVAERLGFPLKHVVVRGEEHARRIWERDFVLVRPDTHVAWRGDEEPAEEEAERILLVVSGNMAYPGYSYTEDLGKYKDEEEAFLKAVNRFAVRDRDDLPTIVGEK